MWPPSRPLASFVLEWCQDQAVSSETAEPVVNILELGAGTGVCGLFAGQALAHLCPRGRVCELTMHITPVVTSCRTLRLSS